MDYAQAYYAAIDPNNEKDTLAQMEGGRTASARAPAPRSRWCSATQRDLGYGRRMTGRRTPTETIAFLVENYQVDPGGVYGFSPLSLEAAVREDTRWRILVNAIECSPGPNGGVSFAKFFNFNAAHRRRGS